MRRSLAAASPSGTDLIAALCSTILLRKDAAATIRPLGARDVLTTFAELRFELTRNATGRWLGAPTPADVGHRPTPRHRGSEVIKQFAEEVANETRLRFLVCLTRRGHLRDQRKHIGMADQACCASCTSATEKQLRRGMQNTPDMRERACHRFRRWRCCEWTILMTALHKIWFRCR